MRNLSYYFNRSAKDKYEDNECFMSLNTVLWEGKNIFLGEQGAAFGLAKLPTES